MSEFIAFRITLKHDKGLIKIATRAPDIISAIQAVLNSENAPTSAIVRAEKISRRELDR